MSTEALVQPTHAPDDGSQLLASGHPAPPLRPPLYGKVLTAFFFVSPIAAAGYLVVDGIGKPFPWAAAGLTLAIILVVGHGVTVGFHRLFAHRAFDANRPLKIVLASLGSLAFQGSIIGWVADHRRHHRYSDRPGDPHSPLWRDDVPMQGAAGFWHAHMGWCFNIDSTSREHYASDLLADRDIVRIDQLFVPFCVATFMVPFAIGYVWSGTLAGALTALLLAGFVRVGITLNTTWSVNSVCHRFGRQPFATKDASTNVALLAPLTMGEAWHNNHHAFPRSARHGLDPGQWDSSARIIRGLERLGWATHVNWPTPDQLDARRA